MDFYMEYFEERVILKIKKLFANNKAQVNQRKTKSQSKMFDN